MYDLSILIPARNEMFLARTVKDIIDNKKGNTEVIVVLDGQLADPGIPVHEDVVVIYLDESVGQREATNIAARQSKAKYLMKVDAHCAFDSGFDVKMMEDMQDDWTMVPLMRHLYAFDWVCKNGHKRFQGKSGNCKECGGETEMQMVWKPNPKRPHNVSYCFDAEPHFQYFNDFPKRPEGKGDITPTMSLQGSCFMLTREKYFELNICDSKAFGSWGSQGIEVAAKTWLTGGSVMVNKKTWYAHMFRTQGGDFGFPYSLSGNQVEHAKQTARDMIFNDKIPGQTRSFLWLLEKFWPVYGWTDDDLKYLKEGKIDRVGEKIIMDKKGKLKRGIIYYTDNELKVSIAKAVQGNIKKVGLPISSTSLKPMEHFGDNFYLPLERGYLTLFLQILIALKRSTADIIYFCEHDVLYHKSHFDFIPAKTDRFYYNTNVYKTDGKRAYRTDNMKQVSGLVAHRKLLIEHYQKRLELIQKNGFSLKMGFEPGTHNRKERVDDYSCEAFESKFPNVDLRHESNLTSTKWSPEEFRNEKHAQGFKFVDKIPGWGKPSDIFPF